MAGASTEATALSAVPHLDDAHPLTHDAAGVLSAARALGIDLHVQELQGSPDEFPQTFAALTQAQVRAVMVHGNPFTYTHRARIAALALEHRLPTMLEGRVYVEAGGLISYGPNDTDMFRRAATYVDKILKGAKPGDLPVEQPTTFERSCTARVRVMNRVFSK